MMAAGSHMAGKLSTPIFAAQGTTAHMMPDTLCGGTGADGSGECARLDPVDGAQNLTHVSVEARSWVAKYHTRYGIQDVEVDQQHPDYEEVRLDTLRLASMVLMRCPLIGTDGPPGERTYVANPMDFRPTDEDGGAPYRLRELGEHLQPDSFSEAGVMGIIYPDDDIIEELFKLNVGDDRIIGFNFDRFRGHHFGIWDTIVGIVFQCYDVFRPEEKDPISGWKVFGRTAHVSIGIDYPTFMFDLMPRKVVGINIDNFAMGGLRMRYLEE